jgi:hypothetical protein
MLYSIAALFGFAAEGIRRNKPNFVTITYTGRVCAASCDSAARVTATGAGAKRSQWIRPYGCSQITANPLVISESTFAEPGSNPPERTHFKPTPSAPHGFGAPSALPPLATSWGKMNLHPWSSSSVSRRSPKQSQLLTAVLSGLLALLLPRSAPAIIFNSTSDPTYNTTAPTGALSNSGWQYEFQWGSFLGTPIDAHHFLLAAHIGQVNPGTNFSFNGTTYTTVTFSDGSAYKDFGDLRLVQVDQPFYSYAPLYDATTDGSEVGRNVVTIGRGTQRGDPVVVNSVTKGWTWGTPDSIQRWGENQVTTTSNDPNAGPQLAFAFDASGTGNVGANEATLSTGDSSGGVFINVNGQWKLAAVNHGVTGPYGFTSTDAPFNAALTDTGGLYNRSNPNNPVFITDTPTDKPSFWLADRISPSLVAIKSYLSLPPTWNVDAGGTWSTSGNWINGGVPDGIGAEADFRYAITAPKPIMLDSNRTLGAITFDSPNGYTIAGSNTLTLDNAGAGASINVASGPHIIATPLVIHDDTTFNIIPPGAGLTLSGQMTASSRNLTKTGHGVLQFRNIRAGGLSINAGRVSVLSDGTDAGVSKVGALAIAPGALLDISNNKLIAGGNNPGTWNGSSYTGIAGLVASARNGGAWNGTTGIISSAITPGERLHGIGVAPASDLFHLTGTQTADWNGQIVTASDTLVMYTYAGDANLDGKINIDDYGRIDSNVGRSGSVFGWSSGDFNFDGKINIDDYGIIDANIGAQSQPLASAASMLALASSGPVTAVPEPATLLPLAIMALGLLAPRHRRPSFAGKKTSKGSRLQIDPREPITNPS